MRISDWSSDVCSSDLLEPGMVVTIEPGIYVIDMLLEKLKQDGHADAIDWSRIDAFRPYGGIRIEDDVVCTDGDPVNRSEEHTSELQSLMRISYAVFCLKKKKRHPKQQRPQTE